MQKNTVQEIMQTPFYTIEVPIIEEHGSFFFENINNENIINWETVLFLAKKHKTATEAKKVLNKLKKTSDPFIGMAKIIERFNFETLK